MNLAWYSICWASLEGNPSANLLEFNHTFLLGTSIVEGPELYILYMSQFQSSGDNVI